MTLHNTAIGLKTFYIIGVAVGTIIVAQVLNWAMKRGFRQFEQSSKKISLLKNEPFEEQATRFVVVRRLVIFIVYFVGLALIIASMPQARTVAVSMLAGAGVAAIIIGFAVQKTFANVISGVVIAFTQPFRIGDRIEFRDQFAVVEDIGLAHTTIKKWDNKRLIIPNSVMTDEVIHNFTIEDSRMARPLLIGVHYETDIEKAKKIIKKELEKHENVIDARTPEELEKGEPQFRTLMTDLGDSAIALRTVFWAQDQPTAFRTEHELRERVKARFDEADITIPYPQRDVHMKE